VLRLRLCRCMSSPAGRLTRARRSPSGFGWSLPRSWIEANRSRPTFPRCYDPPMSTTLRATYRLAWYGLALLGGLFLLDYVDASDQLVDTYGDLATTLLMAVGAGLGIYGARHLPASNRAPTSAELDVMRGAKSSGPPH
jgi:hypothetical protein